MKEYPLNPEEIIKQNDIKDNDSIRIVTYFVQMINAAFYDGFILALCETKEDFDSITLEDRIEACFLAKSQIEAYQGRSKSSPAPVM